MEKAKKKGKWQPDAVIDGYMIGYAGEIWA